jgi:hypothetical protein
VNVNEIRGCSSHFSNTHSSILENNPIRNCTIHTIFLHAYTIILVLLLVLCYFTAISDVFTWCLFQDNRANFLNYFAYVQGYFKDYMYFFGSYRMKYPLIFIVLPVLSL